MCYCNNLACSGGCSATFGGLVDGIDYYSHTASGYNLMYRQTYNPMEDAYRIALRSLEDSFEREIISLHRFYPRDYTQRNDYYRLESEARYRYEKAKNRLYDAFRNASQRYTYQIANQGYGYGLRRYQGWDWGYGQDYTCKFTYLNPKETTPVPTETKKYIIMDSLNQNTYFSDNDDQDVFIPFTTFAEAEKEAQELTRKNPDNEFTIYQTVKKYKVAGTPLDTTVFV